MCEFVTIAEEQTHKNMQLLSLLTIPLSCSALGMCIASLVLPYWNCGGFFTTCNFTLIHIIIIGLLISGLGIFGMVFLFDVVKVCRSQWLPGPVCNTCKVLFMGIGAGALLAGNLLYAVINVKSWSFLLSFSGSIIAVHVFLMALFTSRCLLGK